MDFSITDVLPGLLLSSAVALAAWKKNSLDISGLYAAVVLGTLIYLLGQMLFWLIMIVFFITSSLLSKYRSESKKAVAAEFAKTGRRDWLQVLANGSIGLALALAWRLSDQLPIFAVGYIAAFATVNADTWATELGILSKRPPISILTLKPVTAGVSGAISMLGTGAALAGSCLISVLAGLAIAITHPVNWAAVAAASACGGFTGAILDSLMGAGIQAMYRCQVCGKITEHTHHHGQAARHVRGWPFMGNDAVNWLSSLFGGLAGMGLYLLF